MLKRYRYSLIVSVIICCLSLKSSAEFNRVNIFWFQHIDKIGHLCMYFGFMSVLVFETFITGVNRKHNIIKLALIPFVFGIAMELLQGLLTTTRSASVYDILFNTLGILLSVVLWLTVKNVYGGRFK